MKIAYFLVILSVLVCVNAQCGQTNTTDCSVCLSDFNCVWCHTTSTCRDGDYSGPYNYTCPDFAYYSCSDHNAQSCDQLTSCDTCINQYSPFSCVWCSSTGTCVPGSSSSGPTNSSCTDWQTYSCATCQDYNSCDNCTWHGAYVGNEYYSCGWCITTSTCEAGTSTGPISGVCPQWDNIGDSCAAQDCSAYTTCSDCTGYLNCGWCEADGTCKGGDDLGPDAGTCSNWFYDACPEHCVPITGTSSYCTDLPSKTCSEDASVDASSYNENSYEFASAFLALILCPLHPDEIGFTKDEYCNVQSCSSDNDCNQGSGMISEPLCWDLCMECQGNTTICSEMAEVGLVAQQGDNNCASSFDELFGGATVLHVAPLMVAFLATVLFML